MTGDGDAKAQSRRSPGPSLVENVANPTDDHQDENEDECKDEVGLIQTAGHLE
jgi:hypothetical protein